MKTKNLKKVLSLALAVLMIALAMPFAMLTASAEGEETVKPTISSVTLAGWQKDTTLSKAFGLANNQNIAKAFDGDITTDVYTATYTTGVTLADCLKTSYFDEDGKYGYSETEGFEDGYYHVFFVELDALSTIDTFSLWADSGRDSKWFGPNGYDIWYSADGEIYQTNENLSFSEIGNEASGTYQVDPDIYEDTMWTQSDDTQEDGMVHHVDLNGVEAKYIAIAVTAPTYGSSKFQTCLYELTVDGAVIDPVPPVETSALTIKKVKLEGWRLTSTKSEAFRLSMAANKLFNGIISDSEEVVTTTYTDVSKYGEGAEDPLADFKKTSYFDAEGKYVCSQTETADGKYYVVYFVEFDSVCKVDTFSLWTNSGRTSQWAGPNGYDIWYSADGETYQTNENLSFSEIRNETEVNRDIYVDGTWTNPADAAAEHGATKNVIVHHVDMGGVDAKYIAIAVTEGAYGSTNTFQSILYELAAEGVPGEPDPEPEDETTTVIPDSKPSGDDLKAPELVEDETEGEAEVVEEEKGCGSSIGFGGAALIVATAVGVCKVSLRRKEDE